jgi:hypothetical protein
MSVKASGSGIWLSCADRPYVRLTTDRLVLPAVWVISLAGVGVIGIIAARSFRQNCSVFLCDSDRAIDTDIFGFDCHGDRWQCTFMRLFQQLFLSPF